MRWRGRRQSDNIEDRRGSGGGFGGGMGRGMPVRIPIGGGGGLSLSTIVILVVIFFALKACGIDPLELLEQGQGGSMSQTSGQSGSSAQNDEMKQFVSVVLAETEDTWGGIFKAEGETYENPTLVLFSNGVQSACGTASSAMGPFYCPNDHKVYLDLNFFDQLSQRFGASGDFAQAYVIAHEVGHHVQNLMGTLQRSQQQSQAMGQTAANQQSVKVELQADCYAGIWAHYTDQKGLLENGDLDEALNAAHQIGDDTLQKKSQGYVVPDSFNHGTSAQRAKWFQTGYQSGRMDDCDTFSKPL